MTVEQLVGAKAFLSLDRAGTFICRKDGKEVKFLVYQGAEFCEYDLLYEKETKEENGVIFEIDIKDRWEKQDFEAKAMRKLAYYDTVALMIDGELEENVIYRQDDFQWSENAGTREMHLCLKDVYYEINWKKLGIVQINIPIALRFDLSAGLSVTPPRDSLIYDKNVIKIIKEKICDVADWFQEKYDETVEEFDNFPLAFKHLQEKDKHVELAGHMFNIRQLEEYMSKECKSLGVKGLVINTPYSYYAHMSGMTSNFHIVGQMTWNGVYKTKNIWGDLKYTIQQGHKCILLDQHPVGRVREFLKQKYGRNATFFVESKIGLNFYKTALALVGKPKEEWRAEIQELQELHRQLREHHFVREENIREQKAFLDYVEEQKALAKSGKETVAGVYKTLDKQEGEVTIAYARKALTGYEPVFEKDTFKINELHKSPHIILLFNEEEKEIAKNYFGLHNNLKVGIIGKRERTKLPEIHQIMGKEKFEKTKLFKRIVTALRIEDAIMRWNKILQNDDEMAEECLKKYYELKQKLYEYKNNNWTRLNLSPEARESFLVLAQEHSLWDMEIIGEVEEFEKALETFYFLEYIEYPRYGTEEDAKRVRKIINQLLIYQKRLKALDNYQLVQKPVPDEMLQEQYELDEEFMKSPEAEILYK